MDMLLAVFSYNFIVVVAVILADQRFKKMLLINRSDAAPVKTTYKMPVVMALIISLMFGLFNLLVTLMKEELGGDRLNYYLNYTGYRPSSSAGLNVVISILRLVCSDYRILFCFATFFTVLITLFAYRISADAEPEALFFLLTTQFVFFTFTGIKQCFANAFASLCIIFALRNEGIKDTVFSVILIGLAIWFHPAGFFLIPLYILLRFKKGRWTTVLFFLLMMVSVLFFEPLLLKFAQILSRFIPSLSVKIYEYFGDAANSALEAAGPMSVLKGIPFYIITFVGWYKRGALRSKLANYDNYLILSSAISMIYLASFYNSWLIRLTYFMYLPAAIFFIRVLRNLRLKNNYNVLLLSAVGLSALLTMRYEILIFYNYGGF